MGIDQTTGTDTGVETADDPKPADRPPPPPDQPGLEPEGTPSRLEARKAAAANEQTPEQPPDDKAAPAEQSGEAKPGAAQPTAEVSNESEPTLVDDQDDSLTAPEPYDQGTPTGEQTPGVVEQGEVSGSLTAPLDTSAADDGNGSKVEQQPGIVDTEPDDGAPDNQQTPEKPGDAFEAPGNEPEGALSRADNDAGTAAVRADVTTPQAGEALEQAEDTPPTTGIPGGSSDVHEAVDSRKDEEPPGEPLDAAQPTDTPTGKPAATDFGATTDPLDESASSIGVQPSDDASTVPEIDRDREHIDDHSIPNFDEDSSDETDEIPGERIEPAASGVEAASVDSLTDEASQAEDHHPAFEFDVDDKHVRVFGELDQIKGDIDPSDNVDVEPKPAGDRVAENDELSRFEKLRRKNYENAEEIRDITKKALNNAQDLFSRPPPSAHSETRAGPEMRSAPSEGLHAGDMVTTLMVVGAVIGELAHWGYGKLRQRREVDDGSDR